MKILEYIAIGVLCAIIVGNQSTTMYKLETIENKIEILHDMINNNERYHMNATQEEAEDLRKIKEKLGIKLGLD